MKQLAINTPYVTLTQFLKMTELIMSGGEAKWFLREMHVSINGQPEYRRGRKCYPGDRIEVEGYGVWEILT